MNKKQNYNSIAFLTTLSVYLGLMLVGGTAPVLAHSALTRNFDINAEIVFEEDLDKNPDEEESYSFGSPESYFNDIQVFLENPGNLHQIRKFVLDDRFEFFISDLVSCGDGNCSRRRSGQKSQIDNKRLEAAIADAYRSFEKYAFLPSDCPDKKEFQGNPSKNIKLKIFYDRDSLSWEISASQSSPQHDGFLVQNFSQTYELYKTNAENLYLKEIHKNTSFKSESNQIFIVTRLPRASLESLFTENDAQ
jgi:hypothetical protein